MEIMMQNKQIALAIASLAACGIAAADDLPAAPGQEMVITATRFAQPQETTPANVTVITAQDIQRSSATSLPELISQYTGGHVFTTDGTQSNASFDLRGFGMTGNQNTLVLVDGQRINNLDLSAPSWSSIPVSAIRRIEIIRGSGAVLYGGGATGGVINIITKTPAQATSGKVTAAAGSYATRDVQAQVNTASGPASLRLNAEDYQSDHYRENNRERLKTLDGDFHYAAGNGDVFVKFGADHQNLGLPGTRKVDPTIGVNEFLTDPRGTNTPNDFSNRETARISLGTTQQTGFGEFAGELSYRDKQSDAGFFSYGPYYLHSDLSVLSLTPRLKKNYALFGHDNVLVTGLDISNWTDKSLSGPSANFDSSTLYSRIGATQKNQAVYASNTTHLTAATTLTAGARIQHVEFDAHDALNPAGAGHQSRTPHAYDLGLRHQVTPQVSVYGKIGQSFRIATIDEINDGFRMNMLEPQTSHDRQIGVDYVQDATSLHADLYQMDLTNEIHFNRLVPLFGSNINLPPTRRYGLEVSAKRQLGPKLAVYGDYTYTVAKFREGVFGGVDVAGHDVPVVPRHIANAGATWTFTPFTRLSGNLQFVGSQRFDNDQANAYQKMPAYTVADLKLVHEINRWTTSLAINNLFNKHYFSYGILNAPTDASSYSVYPNPGRNFLLSAAYKF
jgi:iron complex outermembrane recepter protein